MKHQFRVILEYFPTSVTLNRKWKEKKILEIKFQLLFV